jgi:hypothetical protein
MTIKLFDYQALVGLFHYEPLSAMFLLVIVVITVGAACVAAYVGARSAQDLLREKRLDRLREATFAQEADRG